MEESALLLPHFSWNIGNSINTVIRKMFPLIATTTTGRVMVIEIAEIPAIQK
jgi:hypothetical protein